MLKTFICAVLLMFSTTGFAQETAYEEVVTIEVDDGQVEGTLRTPALDEKMPVVLLISGSGPTDRDGNNPIMVNNSLKMIAEELSYNGIASLRYDKRGIAKSINGEFAEKDLRFEDYINDAVQWVEYLRGLDEFSEIIIVGHSEGSLIGMIAAHRVQVDKYVSIAGASEPALEIIRTQFANQPKEVLDAALPIMERLERGEMVEDIPPMLIPIFRPDVQPYLFSWMKYDPSEEIQKLTQPVLIIQGTRDLQITEADANRLANAKPDAQLLIIDGMNHVLKYAPPDPQINFSYYNRPDIALDPTFITKLIAFIQK